MWPYKDFPVKFSESPVRIGGTLKRGFPCYGEDNDYVYGDLIGITESDRQSLADKNVI